MGSLPNKTPSMANKASMANLKAPWKEGKSGNPNGRPKGTLSLVTKMREALDKIHEGTAEPAHVALVKNTLKDAIKTDGQSRKLTYQYLEGLPKGTLDITSGGKPLFDTKTQQLTNNAIGEYIEGSVTYKGTQGIEAPVIHDQEAETKE